MKNVKTINFHINHECNADCVYCFRPEGEKLTHIERCKIIQAIAQLPGNKRRLNFAGGEPTLVKEVPKELAYAKSLGLETSIITNGSVFLSGSNTDSYLESLNMVGLSIDSMKKETNRRLKRPLLDEARLIELVRSLRSRRIVFKINTVVTSNNYGENMIQAIKDLRPDRWKILRAIPIQGINSQSKEDWLPCDEQFEEFAARHRCLRDSGVDVVIEEEDDLRGSYVMIDPEGRFYDSVDSGYLKSEGILNVGIEAAFEQIRYSPEKYKLRGGDFKLKNYIVQKH